MSHNFFKRIDSFNEMYSIKTLDATPEARLARYRQFKKIIDDEMTEGNDVDDVLAGRETGDAMVMMADWLGDIIVYCASEAKRWGIPIEQVLEIIMDSNDSKLQKDGTPLFIEGKLQKGPNYWKPEPKIQQLLESKDDASN